MKRKIKFGIFEFLKIAFGILIILPIIIAAVVAFMPEAETLRIPFKLTIDNPTFDNFKYALKYMNVFTYMKNTIIMIAICLPCQIVTALFAAYAFSHFDFPLKNALFTYITLAMMIPGEVVTITVYKMAIQWDLIDTYLGLVMTSLINVGAVFLYRQTMLSLPKSLREAAVLDGCGDMQYFAKILVPLCKTVIVTQGLNSFIGIYNIYMWPMLVTTTSEMRTVQTGLQLIAGAQSPGYTFAGACILLIAPFCIYIFGIEKIQSGMTAGAVKS